MATGREETAIDLPASPAVPCIEDVEYSYSFRFTLSYPPFSHLTSPVNAHSIRAGALRAIELAQALELRGINLPSAHSLAALSTLALLISQRQDF